MEHGKSREYSGTHGPHYLVRPPLKTINSLFFPFFPNFSSSRLTGNLSRMNFMISHFVSSRLNRAEAIVPFMCVRACTCYGR